MFRLFLVSTFLLFLNAACTSLNVDKKNKPFHISNELVVTTLAPQTYLVKDISFYNSNVLVAKMSEGTVVIVSSPIETQRTNVLIKWVQKFLKPKKIIAINTHFHADGTGGNEAYSDSGAEVWATSETRHIYEQRAETMQKSLAGFVKDKELRKLILRRKNVAPKNVFAASEGKHWFFGDEKVVVHFPGPAHSPDNIVVHFPKRGVLFGGCILRDLSWKNLGNLNDADIGRYYQTAESLLDFEANIVVPGHGEFGDESLILHTMRLAKEQ